MSQTARTDLPAILVIDDSDDDFGTVAIAARRAQVGNPLIHARDIAEARECLFAAPRATYAFVILDCNLPGEDGLDLLEELRQHPQHRGLPVIALTASINPRDRNAFYAAGANAYHVKMVNFTEGLANLESVFHYWLTQVVLPTTDASIIGKSRWL
jgi:two-component system chemotaxis response regulator CheY